MSGGSATSSAANWPTGRTGNCTTSASRPATRPSRPQNRSGGHKRQPRPALPPKRDAGQHLFEQCERAMTTMRFDLRQYSDVLRARSGETVTVRFVEPRDAEPLQNYFSALTTRSRYNRFLGAARELTPSL